jgi:hypothetical protein
MKLCLDSVGIPVKKLHGNFRPLKIVKNQVRWAGKEIIIFQLLTTFLDSAQFQGTYLFYNKFKYLLTGFLMLSC